MGIGLGDLGGKGRYTATGAAQIKNRCKSNGLIGKSKIVRSEPVEVANVRVSSGKIIDCFAFTATKGVNPVVLDKNLLALYRTIAHEESSDIIRVHAADFVALKNSLLSEVGMDKTNLRLQKYISPEESKNTFIVEAIKGKILSILPIIGSINTMSTEDLENNYDKLQKALEFGVKKTYHRVSEEAIASYRQEDVSHSSVDEEGADEQDTTVV